MLNIIEIKKNTFRFLFVYLLINKFYNSLVMPLILTDFKLATKYFQEQKYKN